VTVEKGRILRTPNGTVATLLDPHWCSTAGDVARGDWQEFAEAFKAHSTREDRVAEIAKKLRKDQASVALEKPELWLRLVPTES